MTSPSASTNETIIVYDGECPYCRNYVRLVKLRDTVGPVRLVNARGGGPLVDEIRAAGYDLDEGMIFIYQGQYYHGDEAVHMMGLLSSDSNFANKLNKWIFSSQKRSHALYPFLRGSRNLTLRLLGKNKISGEKF